MTLDFDFQNANTTEFGVGRDDDGDQSFELVPVDDEVQDALGEMAEATWRAMQELSDNPARYEPTEK